jgi:hypothetical protein
MSAPHPSPEPAPKKLKHLELIQAVVNRLANNSFWLKGWTVTIVAALLVLAAERGAAPIPLIGVLVVLVFWGLDGYFLQQERKFRALYDDVRAKSEAKVDFSMNIGPYRGGRYRWASAALSRALWPMYGVLLVAIGLGWAAIRSKLEAHHCSVQIPTQRCDPAAAFIL